MKLANNTSMYNLYNLYHYSNVRDNKAVFTSTQLFAVFEVTSYLLLCVATVFEVNGSYIRIYWTFFGGYMFHTIQEFTQLGIWNCVAYFRNPYNVYVAHLKIARDSTVHMLQHV